MKFDKRKFIAILLVEIMLLIVMGLRVFLLFNAVITLTGFFLCAGLYMLAIAVFFVFFVFDIRKTFDEVRSKVFFNVVFKKEEEI